VADLNQFAEHPLGFLNPKLYALGSRGRINDFINDITLGNNSVAGVQQLPPDAGTPFAVTGYNTTPGYDLASGLGTVDGAQLVGALTRYRSFSTRH